MGHEWVGEVVEVGADVKDVKVGDRILSGGYAGYAEYAPLGVSMRCFAVKVKKLFIPEETSRTKRRPSLSRGGRHSLHHGSGQGQDR